MITFFTWRSVEYRVSGWLWGSDGAGNGLIVARVDGRKIRGTHTLSGMVQVGLSRGLSRAAEHALNAERARRADEVRS